MEELEREGLVEAVSSHREVFKVTHRGYQFMDTLNAQQDQG